MQLRVFTPAPSFYHLCSVGCMALTCFFFSQKTVQEPELGQQSSVHELLWIQEPRPLGCATATTSSYRAFIAQRHTHQHYMLEMQDPSLLLRPTTFLNMHFAKIPSHAYFQIQKHCLSRIHAIFGQSFFFFFSNCPLLLKLLPSKPAPQAHSGTCLVFATFFYKYL